MPYDERLQELHPYVMTKDQLKMEAEHINGMLQPGVHNPELERRLAMIDIADSQHDRLMSAEPSQVMLSAEVEFSPALKAEIARQEKEHTTNMEWASEYRNARGITEGDFRDFAAMVEYDEGMTEEAKKAKFTQFMEDYYSGDPERRKKCLDSFANRMDAIDPLKLDLSCLKQPGTTGDGSGRLTASERDLLVLLDRFRNDQTLTVKSKVENPDYFDQRYGTPEAKERVRIQRDTFTHAYDTYLCNGLLAYNGFTQNLKTEEEMGLPEGQLRMANAGFNIDELFWSGIERVKLDIAAFEGLPSPQIWKSELQPDNFALLQTSPISRDANGAFTRDSANLLNRVYADVIGKSFDNTDQMRTRADLGIRDSDMLFIDGVSANELYGAKYSGLPLAEQEKRIKQEVAATALEGQHRIEVASIHNGAHGEYKTMLSPVEFNMHAMDAAEKSQRSALRRMFDFGPFKIKTTADLQDALSKNDPDREERQAQITQSLGAVITQKALAKADLETRGPARERQERMEAERQKNRSLEADAILQPEEAAMTEARQRVAEADAVNKDLRSQYTEIDAEQFKAENYSRAVRKFGEIEGLLDGMTGMNGDKDISHPAFNSLHEALPVNTDRTKANELNKIYLSRIMPDMRLYEFADQNQAASMEELIQQQKEEWSHKTPNQQKIELLEKMIAHPDPEERERIRDEYLENMKAGMKEYLAVYKDALDNHPNRELANPDAMAERSTQLAELRGQMKQVPDEVLKAAALKEARVYMLKEDNGLLKPEDKPRDKAGYVIPQTKEEALQRIADIDKQNLEAKPFMEANEQVMKGKSFFTGDPMAARSPQMVRLEIREFLQYMDGLQIDTSVLGDKEREAYEGVKKQMETIAGQEPTAPISIAYPEISGLSNAMVNAQAAALGAKPEFVRISKSDNVEKDYYRNMGERERLIRDLAKLEREEEKTKDSKKPEVEQEKGKEKDKTEASKRDKVDMKDLTREAAEAGEMTSSRQRSRSLSAEQTQKQTRERSMSDASAEKPAHKQDGPSKR